VAWTNYDIVGSYNNQRFSEFSAERTINLFEYIDSQGKKDKTLIFTSGLTNTNLSFTPQLDGFRASFVFNDNAYVIIGNSLFQINSSLTVAFIGNISNSTGYVGIDANTFQILFVDGQNGWIYDTIQNTFVQITDPSFPAKPIDCCYLDGFFVVANGDTNTFQLSQFNQGLVWGPVSMTFTVIGPPTTFLTVTSTASLQIGVPIRFTTTGTLPAPLVAGDTYYIVSITPTTIEISSTPGGTPITLTTVGVGVHTLSNNGQVQLGSITSHPGTIVACRTLHRRLFLFSQNYTEVWENAGLGTNLPFRRNNTLLMEYGTPSRASVAVGFDKMFFLSQDKDGLGSVMEVIGTQSVPVSNRALDFQLAQYSQQGLINENDPSSILIKENGLIFYRLNFTQANHTFVYNVTISNPSMEEGKLWHEEEVLNGDRHPAQTHFFFNGINYYGDYIKPVLYIVDSNNCTNDTENIRRMRIGKPIGSPEYKRIRIDRFHLDLLQGQLIENQFKINFTADTATDILTLSDPTTLVTGHQVMVTSTGILPIPLAVNTIYYAIVLTPTQIRLATTYANAISNSYIDITSSGQPENSITYVFNDPSPPPVFLSYSKDGGQSYGNKLTAQMGAVGQRSFRTVWRKLGTVPRGQYFVPKIEFFSQTPFVILGAAWVFEEMPE
jgi:hypothetical protein